MEYQMLYDISIFCYYLPEQLNILPQIEILRHLQNGIINS